jgi:hypothetical protein
MIGIFNTTTPGNAMLFSTQELNEQQLGTPFHMVKILE